MTFKALLLGSAAALATAGGAQAADLMADSVDYVRICDAFGTGYFYIPGTDTCIRLGGQVQFNARYGENIDHETEDGHNFDTTIQLKMWAAKMTAHGPLIGYMALKGTGREDGDNDVFVDEATLQWGNWLMGFTDSLTKVGGQGNWGGDEFKPNASSNLIAYSFTHSGHALSIGLEDANEGVNDSATGGEIPALTAQISGELGHVEYGIGLGWVQGEDGLDSGHVVTGSVEFDMESTGFNFGSFSVWAGYGENAGGAYALQGAGADNGSHFVWGAAWRHKWSDDWRTGVTYSEYDGASGEGSDFGANLVYVGVRGLQIGPGIRIFDRVGPRDAETTFHFRAQFDW